MYYVYLLQSKVKINWLYVGRTDNLKIRFIRHNQGKVKSTKAYKPFILVYYEAYLSKKDAVKREIELKKHQKKEILKEQLKHSIKLASVCPASQDLAKP